MPQTSPSPDRLLRRGDDGPDVCQWQYRLKSLGFDCGVADGLFGYRTESTTKALQRARGLVPDGIVGPQTRAAAVRQGKQVAKITTSLTEAQLAEALSAGHQAAFGTLPAHPRLGCAWAQAALEHDRGKAVYCHNIGNVSAFGGYSGNFYVIRVQERIKRDPDEWKWVDMKFRAHADHVMGAKGFWLLIAGRYGNALDRFDAGDPSGAANALSRAGYFTARAEQYAAAMVGLYREWTG